MGVQTPWFFLLFLRKKARINPMNFDLIIMNGQLLDGSGKAAIHTDIGIRGDSIAALGDLSAATAEKSIDASGCIVCPGFTDAHSHSDTYLLIEPSAASKIYQGITTEICGNCGASAAPLNGSYKMPSDWLDKDYSHVGQTFQSAPPWSTVADYRTLFAEARPAVNAALLVGHNTLHAGICGYDPRAATPDEMKKMFTALEQALDEGAIGLSSGLLYPPGSAVPRSELIELAKVIAKHDGIYTTHMRSESDGLLDAIDEAIEIAERSSVRLHISHLKASGKANWHKLDAALTRLRTGNLHGCPPISADRYPYLAGCTDLDIVLPSWASHGGRDAVLARLRDPDTRNKIRADLMAHPPGRWADIMIGSTQFEHFKGKYLPEVAETLGMNTVDALLHLIDADDLKTGGIFFGMSEENMWKVLAEPYVSLGSDGSLRAPWGPLSHDHPHPRAYGSHTKFLRAALDGKTVPLPEAIRKMTALPAEQFGLKKRGQLKVGYFADIAIFDPDAIRENTTYADPHQLSSGLRHLFVNGSHTLENGAHTDHRNGQFLI